MFMDGLKQKVIPTLYQKELRKRWKIAYRVKKEGLKKIGGRNFLNDGWVYFVDA